MVLLLIAAAIVVSKAVDWMRAETTTPYSLAVGEPVAPTLETNQCERDDPAFLVEFGLDETGESFIATTHLDALPEDGSSQLLVELNGTSRSLDLNGEDFELAAAVGPDAGDGSPVIPDLEAVGEDVDVARSVKLLTASRNNIDESESVDLAARYDSASRRLSLSVPMASLGSLENEEFDVHVRVLSGPDRDEVASCES